MSSQPLTNRMSPEDLEAIKQAKHHMENIGFVMKGLNKLGNSLDSTIKKIPAKQQLWLQKQVNKSLTLVVKSNLVTMQNGKTFKKPSNKTYKALVTTTGALSGVLGSTTGIGTAIFASELAVSTKFMMRSILDIARSHGENLQDFETQMACMQVFALGGKSKDDDGLETSYYTMRLALNSAAKGASAYVAKNGVQGLNKMLIASSNPLMKLIGIIAGRFSIQVSEKFVAQAIPVLGAVGGGTINFVFLNHFQTVAEAHFKMRSLERKYGNELVISTYNNLKI
ncbi:EcsC family protein [Confluentibacter citreus]|uniref:EcsC family protein n=1 Tax=Confluentibacter citreus TaxID=2007307 RepID=UPI000C2906DE|nr:EcsC family protein [Confluentibacter citreus]